MVNIKFKIFLTLCLILFFHVDELSTQTITHAQAESQNQIKTKAQTDVVYTEPEVFFLELLNEVRELNSQGMGITEKVETFRNLFINYFDTKNISRLVIGRYWRKISDKQKEEFTSVFLEHLFWTFIPKLDHYLSQGILQMEGHNEYKPNHHIITSKYIETGKKPIKISWVIVKAKEEKTYKIVDVQIEGISFIISRRSEYSSVIRREGIDELVTKLSELVNRKKEEMGLF